jgi:hypothetical protein
MSSRLGKKAALSGMLLLGSLIALQAPSAIAQAPGTQQAVVTGPHSIWWASSIWNNRAPGSTIRYLFLVYNTDPAGANMTLKALSLQTPWGNYNATGLPTSLCSRCRYAWADFITIPTTQQPGNLTFYTRLTGNYGSGAILCADTGNVCLDVTPVVVTANSTSPQQSGTGYSTLDLSLGVGIPTIIAVVLLALYLRKPSVKP